MILDDKHESKFRTKLNSANTGVFIPYGELISIYKKVSQKEKLDFNNIQNINSGRNPYGLTTNFFNDPSKYKLPDVSTERHSSNDIEIYGLCMIRKE